MSEEKKPDAYLAINHGTKQPLQGFIFVLRHGGQHVESEQEAAYRALRNHLEENLSQHMMKERYGLVLCPVKLVFLDEPTEQGSEPNGKN